MWKNRSRLLFAAGVGISGLILLQMGMYTAHMLFGIDLSFNVFQICRYMLRSLGIEYVIYALDGLVLYTFGLLLIKGIRQILATRQAMARLSVMKNNMLSAKLNRRYAELGNRIIVIDYEETYAFTIGMLNPHIVLSSGLLAMLDKQEEAAVVYHEAHHMRHYDPLKTWLISLVSSAIWYVPVLGHILKHYKTAREVLADNEAITRTGSPAGIGSALLKLLRNPPSRAFRASTAYSSFAETSINYRISRILDPHKDPAIKLPLTSVMVSGHMILGLTLLFALALL
ncbi:M56 family metallopeptidase [Paenibacillus sp. JX-17]|uniref:M56 family metallopeptidase n=1 Tax=Paenibacillus lacisoli TaxID=3064525 RepID=A0ABT9CB03_9BACL|nr:M56 family metallopeptidase [Paenibacillus sp. JX-17]MDO7906438.1 M56 family metallopeptidase [Paenibacillus sp. JX-17]